MAQRDWPSVSVVLVNLDGLDYLDPCLRSVYGQDYPGQVEVILVDNASEDGSVEFVRREFPRTQVIVNDTNTGFAPAVNQGARAGSGELVALLNNDAVADPAWLRHLVKPLVAFKSVACTGGLVLDSDGRTVDFAGGGASFSGHGFPLHHGDPPPADLRTSPTLFVTGSSLVARRKLFLEVGGMDEDYFAYYEDVDFGWRLWILGYEVLFVPDAVTYHEHHGTISRFGNARERFLLERNALFTIFKNFEDDRLARSLPAATVLSLIRGLEEPGTDLGDYSLTRETRGTTPEVTVSPMTGAHLAAVNDFAGRLPELKRKRAWIQAHRRRPDREVLRHMRAPLGSYVPSDRFVEILDEFAETFDLLGAATAQQRVLIVCADTLGEKMAGPAIRSWEMAKVLSREHEVVLGTLSAPGRRHAGFTVEHLTPETMAQRIAWAEVIVMQGVVMWWYPQMVSSDAAIVVDLYAPFHVEAIEVRKDESLPERWAFAGADLAVVNQQLQRGDFFLCASDKQRDFWLGHLTGAGRLNPANYDYDPDLRGLLSVVPFGLPPEPPVQERHAIKGAIDGIEDDDIVAIWGGGIYNWFDPVTLIEAVARAAEEEPRLKLFFLGTAHPNPDIPKMRRASDAYRAAESLGVLDKHVFFNDGWVDYEQRADYLLDADFGVSTHFLHVETELSFRTRILDYLWASLPIVGTEGDSLSRMVREHDLGEVVKAEDVDDLTAALLAMCQPERRAAARANIEELAPTMTWERVLEPLMSFCRAPRRSPDVLSRQPQAYISGLPTVKGPRVNPAAVARRFIAVAQDKGLATAVHMARQRLRRGRGR
ncbi:MAG TPA: glycosyltransferase [Nitriliruptorales bacterium]